jgi:mRNA-degrading endonuclease YafQ of YafQ-DinJ toxin-antitoxin module
MKIELSGRYDQMYRELLRRDPCMAKTVTEKTLLFRKNSKDTRLHAHTLKKRMRGKYAFSVTDDIRIIFVRIGKSTARFLAIGSHEDVYTRP